MKPIALQVGSFRLLSGSGANRTKNTALIPMNKTTTVDTRTVVRQPALLEITSYRIQASDPYGLEITGDGEQIMNALVDFIADRHREAQSSYSSKRKATEDLERLAGAMGLAYGVKTEEA
jgi:hypothetical protein